MRVENLEDAPEHIGEVIRRVKKEHLKRAYKIEDWYAIILLLFYLHALYSSFIYLIIVLKYVYFCSAIALPVIFCQFITPFYLQPVMKV